MNESKGMLGGIFSKNEKNNFRYLVSTLWDNIDNHNNYEQNKLPVLQNKADTVNDITEITGKTVFNYKFLESNQTLNK